MTRDASRVDRRARPAAAPTGRDPGSRPAGRAGGRLPRPARADEAVVDDVTAAARHLHVGSRIRLWAFTAAQQGNPETTVFSKYPAPAGPAYTFHVVGVIREPGTVDAPPASAVR